MLLSISISNFILIDFIDLEIKSGLTVLTGETGAGKSIILDALVCTLGERASNKLIRNKDKPANITATFDIRNKQEIKNFLDEQGIESDENLILRRSISSDGKSKAFINSVPCTISQLQFCRDYLVEICGQHDSRGLLDSSQHIKLLDQFASIKLEDVKNKYKAFRKLESDFKLFKEKLAKSEIEKSFLKMIIQELKDLSIKNDEENELTEQRKLLSEGTKIKDSVKASEDLISNAILPSIYKLQKELAKFDYFKSQLEMVNKGCIEIEESLDSITEVYSKFGSEYDNLESLEDRLFKIRSIARKYNTLSEEFPELLKSKEAELEILENAEFTTSEFEKKLLEAKNIYLQEAKKISELRAEASKKLQEKILEHFADLKLEKADFKIEQQVYGSESQYSELGIDKIIFLIKTNPGMPFDQLSKIASGGELSRFLLAIKVASLNEDAIPTMIFDEIDTGVSGAVSSAIGRKLSHLAKNGQVIVVTHQPQVAAYADNHLVVSKEVVGDSTAVFINTLDKVGKEQEVARLLSGEDVSEESIAAAKKLIQLAA